MSRPPPSLALLVFSLVFLRPSDLVGQVVDSVQVQVEATTRTISALEDRFTVRIDPRPELRRDSVGAAVLRAFEQAGFEDYTSPGVPPSNVILIAPGRIYSRGTLPVVQTAYHGFGDRTDEFPDLWRGVYHTVYRLDCAWGGGQCIVGRELDHAHGDGLVGRDCWDDYFSRTEAERRECWYRT